MTEWPRCVYGWRGEVSLGEEILRSEEKAVIMWEEAEVGGGDLTGKGNDKHEDWDWNELEVPEGQKNGQWHCVKAINEIQNW